MIIFVFVFNFLHISICVLTPNCNISIQLAREQAQNAANQGMQSETSDTCNAVVSSTETPTPTAANAASLNTSLTSNHSNGLASSPSSVTPIAATDSQQSVSGLSGSSVSHSIVTPSTTGVEPSTVVTTSAAPTIVAGSSGLAENSPQQSKMPPLYKTLFCMFIVYFFAVVVFNTDLCIENLPAVLKIKHLKILLL